MHMHKLITVIILFLFSFSYGYGTYREPSDYRINQSEQALEPEFVRNIENVSVIAGNDAVLSCVVSNLGKYKVAWVKRETQHIYAIHVHVVTRNIRISLSHDGRRTWNLHFQQVRQEDRGSYTCQINTDPMKSQDGRIDVIDPEATDPEATDPEATDPEATDPEATDPEATGAEATDPEDEGSVPKNPSSSSIPQIKPLVVFFKLVFEFVGLGSWTGSWQ